MRWIATTGLSDLVTAVYGLVSTCGFHQGQTIHQLRIDQASTKREQPV
ncbi:hypothetical protein [Mucilaginibacter pineti]|nr:hypothetical protein [Mucilaginibacter pineti]